MNFIFFLFSILFVLTACNSNEKSCKDYKEQAYQEGFALSKGYNEDPLFAISYGALKEDFKEFKTEEYINNIKKMGCYEQVEKEYDKGKEDGFDSAYNIK